MRVFFILVCLGTIGVVGGLYAFLFIVYRSMGKVEQYVDFLGDWVRDLNKKNLALTDDVKTLKKQIVDADNNFTIVDGKISELNYNLDSLVDELRAAKNKGWLKSMETPKALVARDGADVLADIDAAVDQQVAGPLPSYRSVDGAPLPLVATDSDILADIDAAVEDLPEE